MEDLKNHLIDVLKSKSGLKQDIYKNTIEWFKVFKSELQTCASELREKIEDQRVRVRFEDISDSEAHIFLGSDILIFHMHTNVFKFSDQDFATKTSYVQKNESNSFCGVINIYDFLADSYEYNRQNDLGYLIGRIFINRENHFLVEGKGQLGFLYRDFMHQTISKEIIADIIYRVALYALDFDLLNPPYDNVNQVSVYELQTLSLSSKLKTGKRLGFQFASKGNIEA